MIIANTTNIYEGPVIIVNYLLLNVQVFLSLFKTVSFVSQKNIVLSFRMLKAFFLILRALGMKGSQGILEVVLEVVWVGRLIGSLFYLYGRVPLINNHYQFSQMLGTNVKKNHAHTIFLAPKYAVYCYNRI